MSHAFNEILAPVINEVKNYTWLLSYIEYGGYQTELPINMDDEYFILSPKEFDIILNADVQICWGTILGIENSVEIIIDQESIPFAEGNDLIWKDGNIQHPNAEIEIDCWDSGYTIVKFKNSELSYKFRAYFPEAIELEKFK